MPEIRLIHVLEATVGGTRRHLLDLCRGLPPERFEQHVIYSSLRDPHFEAEAVALRAAGIEATALPVRREIEPVEDWHCLRGLQAVVKRWQPHVIHGHSAKGGFLARLAGRACPGARVVYTPHGFAFQMRTDPLRHWLYLWLERQAARYTDALVAVGEGQRELALQHGLLAPERITVIPNGVRSELFAGVGEGAGVRGEFGLPAEALLLGTVAALSPQKGLEYLLRAVAAVRRERPEVALLIVGEGLQRGALVRQARLLGLGPNVVFAGLRSDIPRLLGALDLFVLPSLWEGLPYALLEAGATGLPAVATAVPGNTDLIRPGETGWLARPADPLDLAVQLFAALGDPERSRRGQALQSLVREHYSLPAMVAGHVALYEKLVRS